MVYGLLFVVWKAKNNNQRMSVFDFAQTDRLNL